MDVSRQTSDGTAVINHCIRLLITDGLQHRHQDQDSRVSNAIQEGRCLLAQASAGRTGCDRSYAIADSGRGTGSSRPDVTDRHSSTTRVRESFRFHFDAALRWCIHLAHPQRAGYMIPRHLQPRPGVTWSSGKDFSPCTTITTFSAAIVAALLPPGNIPLVPGHKQHVNAEARCTVEIFGSADEQQG